MESFDRYFSSSIPSLVGCQKLTLSGAVQFEPGVICRGTVTFQNRSDLVKTVAAGIYDNQVIEL